MVMLMSMGFGRQHVEAALGSTGGDMERAADWLFSRSPEEMDAAVAAAARGAGSEAAPQAGGASVLDAGCGGRYTLMAIVSHIGRNTDHGHYVCHALKDQWALFNDDKVAASEAPPLDCGFMYLYRRDDGPGAL